MRKLIILVLIVLIVLITLGCAETASTSDNTKNIREDDALQYLYSMNSDRVSYGSVYYDHQTQCIIHMIGRGGSATSIWDLNTDTRIRLITKYNIQI